MAFGPHPDDIELGCSGALIKLSRSGKSVVLVDLTRGELSTRGTVELRSREAEQSAKLLGATRRINLGLSDGNIENTPATRLAVIRAIVHAASAELRSGRIPEADVEREWVWPIS